MEIHLAYLSDEATLERRYLGYVLTMALHEGNMFDETGILETIHLSAGRVYTKMRSVQAWYLLQRSADSIDLDAHYSAQLIILEIHCIRKKLDIEELGTVIFI